MSKIEPGNLEYLTRFLGVGGVNDILALKTKAINDGRVPKYLVLPKVSILGMEITFADITEPAIISEREFEGVTL